MTTKTIRREGMTRLPPTPNYGVALATQAARSRTSIYRVLVALAAAMVSFLIYGIATDSSLVIYYIPITVILTGVIALIHRSVGFPTAVLWGLAGAAIGNMAGGVLRVAGATLYELPVLGSIRYDKVFHAVAAGVVAWASLEALASWGLRRTFALGFGAAMMAFGGGALVEMVEYFGSLIIEDPSVGGYTNNAQDLIANTVGAVVGTTLAYRFHRTHGDRTSRLASVSDALEGLARLQVSPRPDVAGLGTSGLRTTP